MEQQRGIESIDVNHKYPKFIRHVTIKLEWM